jgi:N-acylneuraminate cytidylyltransferase
MVSVPATAPLRQPIDIENCLDEYAKGDADVVITVSEAHRSPYFNMVRENADGSVGLVIPSTSAIARRQDVPVVYDMATVAYVVRPEFVLSSDAIFKGRVRAVQVPRERSIDIDTLFDFQIAEHLLTHNEL